MTASFVIGITTGIVTAGENAVPLQSSGGKATKTPRQPFAEIATQVSARVSKKADNVVVGKAPRNPRAGGEEPPVPTPGILTHTVAAKPPTTETRKTAPRAPTGETPALETLVQIGCEAAVGPASVQPVKGPPPKVVTANPAILEGKEEMANSPVK
jgi:hypothetical protein